MVALNEYAQLASIVYAKTDENSLPVPTAEGWSPLLWLDDDPLTGFSAGVYRKGNEIVISYTGTNGEFNRVQDYLNANIEAGSGQPAAQVIQAMQLYMPKGSVSDLFSELNQ